MEEQLFRVIIVGDTGVGKSCLLLRFSEDKFHEDHNVTIGVEFGTRSLKVGNQMVKLQIWDTAGQESFRSITRSFYRRADGVLLVYDVTARHTFENCSHWMEEIRNNGNSDVIIFLVGNQTDLIQSGQIAEVSINDAEQFAKINNLSGFIETSAKANYNVEKAFTDFCQVLLNRWSEKSESAQSQPINGTNLKQAAKKQKKKCC